MKPIAIRLTATAALLVSLSACASPECNDCVREVTMSEASYQNLYGAYADTCDGVAGDACAATTSY